MRHNLFATLALVSTISAPTFAGADLLLDGAEFQANTYTMFNQSGVPGRAVARSADGSFVVIWDSNAGQDGTGYSVHGQRYDSTGAPAGTEFRANTYTFFDQGFPAVSSASDGRFVVVWRSLNQDSVGFRVRGQRFDSAGNTSGTEFRVDPVTIRVPASGDPTEFECASYVRP